MTIVKKTVVETVEIYKVIKHGFNNPSSKSLQENETEVMKATVGAISFRTRVVL